MKAIVTFIFIIFLGTSAMAQKELKVETFTAGVELNISIDQDGVQGEKIARLYMFKNSRVKKALKFRTKRNASKIA